MSAAKEGAHAAATHRSQTHACGQQAQFDIWPASHSKRVRYRCNGCIHVQWHSQTHALHRAQIVVMHLPRVQYLMLRAQNCACSIQCCACRKLATSMAAALCLTQKRSRQILRSGVQSQCLWSAPAMWRQPGPPSQPLDSRRYPARCQKHTWAIVRGKKTKTRFFYPRSRTRSLALTLFVTRPSRESSSIPTQGA